MRDDLSPGRLGAVPAIVFGFAALLSGVGIRLVTAVGQTGLHADDRVTAFATLLSAAALVFALMARPKYHRRVFILPWVAAGCIALFMAGLAALEPEIRSSLSPASLEAAGGVALLLALTRWREATLIRDHRWPEFGGQAKSELHHDEATSALVPASALLAKDEVRVNPGEPVPVDGHLSSDLARIDEGAVMGAGHVVDKRNGDPIFAGSKSDGAMRVTVDAPWDESWAAQRNSRHDRLKVEQLEPDRTSRAAAGALTTIAVAVCGFAISQYGPFSLSAWLPSVAGVLTATVTVGPSLGRMRGRIAFLHGMHQAGLVISRARDLRALMRISRWLFDARLLAAPGPVEVVELSDVAQNELLVVSEALLREEGGPRHASVLTQVNLRELDLTEGAALRHTENVYRGTVNGRRWFMGTADHIKTVFQFEVDPAHRGALVFFEERKQTPWLIGRDDVGIVGILSIGLEVDAGVQSAAKTLAAKVIKTVQEAPALAERAGIKVQKQDPTAKDAVVLSEGLEPPKAGLRIRVVPPEPAQPLPSAGAPRLMKPALVAFAQALPLFSRYRAKTSRFAWGATAAGLLFATVVALLLSLPPWVGTVIGCVTVWLASGSAPEELTDASALD